MIAAQENDPSIVLSEPLAVAPVVIATGVAPTTDTSLEEVVDDAITTLLDERALVRPSRRFLRGDHTMPPPDEAQPTDQGALPSEEVQP
jgi:hypothetical protein